MPRLMASIIDESSIPPSFNAQTAPSKFRSLSAVKKHCELASNNRRRSNGHVR